MKNSFEKGSGESVNPHEDEVGKPIWKMPDEGENEHGHEEDEDDFEIPFIPPLSESHEVGIHVPPFDPSLQREWEERERRREEGEKKENPRGYWEM